MNDDIENSITLKTCENVDRIITKADSSVEFSEEEDIELFEEPYKLSISESRALLLVIVIACGTNFPAVKYLEKLCFDPPCHHLPSEAAFARFGLSAVASIPILINQRNKAVIFAGFELGVLLSIGYLSQASALESIAAGKCAFFMSLMVVVVPILNSIFFRKPILKINILSAFISVCGVSILEGVGTSQVQIGSGDAIALFQALGFGLAFIRTEQYVEKYKDVPNRILTMTAAQCTAVGFISFLWVLWDFHTIPNLRYMMEPHHLTALVWTGVITTLGVIYFEGYALQTASATDAALLFATEPVWAAIFGKLLLHEQVHSSTFIGGALILIACVLPSLIEIFQQKKLNVE